MNSTIKAFLFSLLFLFTTLTFANKPPLTDIAITNEIKAKIAADKLLSVSNVDVNVMTDHQIVSFSGTVNSESEASTLVEIAESTADVKDVNTSKLSVKDSKQPLSDAFITAKVKGKFIQEKLFKDKDISAWTIKVETNDGVVTLTGKADNKAQVENAIKLARSVSGVSLVKYRIKLISDHSEIENY